MPSVFVPIPVYPIVPPYPGVPPLPIPIGGLPYVLPILAVVDALGLPFFNPPPRWGIFTINGEPLIADSVYSVEYTRDYNISDYPQQQGSFQSYNKVITPYVGKVTYLISKTRGEFLNNIEAACASLQLVTIITPEVPYLSANLTHYSYRREAKSGVTLIRVDVWLKEVRITAGTELSPNSANPPGPGTVQSGIPATSPNPSNSSTQIPASTLGTAGTTSGAPASEGGNPPQYYTPPPAAGSLDASQSVNAAPVKDAGVVQPTYPPPPPEKPPIPASAGQPVDWGTVDLTHAPQ